MCKLVNFIDEYCYNLKNMLAARELIISFELIFLKVHFEIPFKI